MAEIEGEEWRPIPGYDGLYDVSNLGRIRSWSRAKDGDLLKFIIGHRGYPQVNLYCDGRVKTRRVPQLVLEAFVGPRPAGTVACYGDGIKGNVALSNLRWDTAKANGLEISRQGRHPESKRTHCDKGHEYSEANTKWIATARSGARRPRCLICKPLPKD
ncbi:NUMOD4 domain-containing protein [Actinacidiphila rubida]|uniref:HNH endonuclease n=1 Tax=Actinacidiphila rubida TaxID=310780 RepID=A0A1H8L8X0_9ACTN|nr:HNH endonuclease [Actinacidiphila rubida]